MLKNKKTKGQNLTVENFNYLIHQKQISGPMRIWHISTQVDATYILVSAIITHHTQKKNLRSHFQTISLFYWKKKKTETDGNIILAYAFMWRLLNSFFSLWIYQFKIRLFGRKWIMNLIPELWWVDLLVFFRFFDSKRIQTTLKAN